MKKRIVGVTLVLLVFLVGLIGISFAAPDGSVAQGKISVFKDGKLSKKLSGMSPVDEDAMLICDGKCMIKSNGVSVLAEDKAELAISNRDGFFNIFVRRGHVEFIISESANKIAFHTPSGAYSVADVMFNASNDSVVRGYMNVDDSTAKVGVREGRMIFATDDGAKAVNADEYIILAMSDVKKKEDDQKKAGAIIPAASGSAAASTVGGAGATTFLGMTPVVAGGVVVATAAAVGIGIAASNSGGGGGGSVVSPAQ